MIIRNRLIETELVKQMTLVVVLASHHRRLRHKMPLEDGITVRQSLQITSATKSARSGHSRVTDECPLSEGGLNRSTQHFILKGKDGVCGDRSNISSRFHRGREDGVVGSLAAGRVTEGNRTSLRQAVIVDLLPGRPARRDSSTCPASLAVGIDGFRARGDIERHCGASISTVDGEATGPLTLDGKPRTQPQWRL